MTPSHVLEQLLCLIVADAAKSGLQYSTIKTYLAAVRDFAIANGGRDPFAGLLPTLGKAMLCQAGPRATGTRLSTACDAGHSSIASIGVVASCGMLDGEADVGGVLRGVFGFL